MNITVLVTYVSSGHSTYEEIVLKNLFQTGHTIPKWTENQENSFASNDVNFESIFSPTAHSRELETKQCFFLHSSLAK